MLKANNDIQKVGNNILLYILAFAIPFLVIILAYIGLHITPFGDKTIIISDAKALYMSDLSFISRLLRGKEDLLYSFEQGIGMNLMGTHSGLLNPANIIVLLFDITSFPMMYSWLMAIDMAFCGLTMFVLLSSVYGRETRNLIFSTVYALIGFNVSYCFHYNFLLSVELLPLIALGIKKILKGQSPWLYLISLSYSILASFYFGYMLCIASVTLFLMWYSESVNGWVFLQKKRVLINYAGSSVIAGLLPAMMWIPTFLSFSGGRMEQNSLLDFTMSENMSISDAFAKLFIGANNTNELVYGQPNIFCGLLVVFLCVAFFLDRRNTSRLKINRAVPLIFYFVTFYIKALSMVMQGFSETNWFNHRYSFVFSFLMILVAFEEYSQIRTIDTKDFKKTCVVFATLIILVFSQKHSFVSGGWMIAGVAILVGCLGAIWWNRIDEKKAPEHILSLLLILLCSIECYANYMVSTSKLFDWAYNEKEYQEDLFYGSVLSEAIKGHDGSFFRMTNEYPTNERCNNDPRLFGYNGINYFGSCEKTFVFQGMSRLGMPWWSNRMWYAEGEPPAFDSLFGLKYVIARRDLSEEKQYEKKATFEKDTIYMNKNALPIGMVVGKNISSVTLERNPFKNHNNIWRKLTECKEDVFTLENEITFTYHANNDGKKLSYIEAQEYSTSLFETMERAAKTSDSNTKSSNNGSESEQNAHKTSEEIINSGRYIECSFTARKGGRIYSYIGAIVQDESGSSTETMNYIGNFKKGEVVRDYIPINSDISLDYLKGICAEYYVAYANNDVLDSYCQKLQGESGELHKITDSHLTGSVSPVRDSRLFFTIPYDEGWSLKVDGVDTKIDKTADLFMSALISSGSHTYELSFFPKGMKTGMKVTVGAVGLLILLIIYNAMNKSSQKGLTEKEDFSAINITKNESCDLEANNKDNNTDDVRIEKIVNQEKGEN